MASPLSTSSSLSDNVPVPMMGRRRKVSPEHTLNRVRENQRRHRARRRDYISHLEEKLAETEKHLEEARAEIAVLRAERKSGCWKKKGGTHEDSDCEKQLPQDMRTLQEQEFGVDDVQLSFPPLPLPQIFENYAPGLSLSDPTDLPKIRFLGTFNLPLPLPESQPALPGPPPCCEDDASHITNLSSSSECASCATMPPPLPSESTTLCSQAYVLIAQQNFRGIDVATIRMWLWQGRRRAQREGEGCRVENGALMSLLDFISGV